MPNITTMNKSDLLRGIASVDSPAPSRHAQYTMSLLNLSRRGQITKAPNTWLKAMAVKIEDAELMLESVMNTRSRKITPS